jgi:hypothetical protein
MLARQKKERCDAAASKAHDAAIVVSPGGRIKVNI